MNIIVLNGSPKGEKSITMQSVLFIQRHFPKYNFKIVNITHEINTYEKDECSFNDIINEIHLSDAVLWAFPLIHFHVHSHYKRFIELIYEKSVQSTFKNKYTAVFTTSIHYFDHCAHNYMNAVCDDLNMKFTGSYSADMNDLPKEPEQKRLLLFARNFFTSVKNRVHTVRNYNTLVYDNIKYIPVNRPGEYDTGSKKMLMVTDSSNSKSNLTMMTERFRNFFSNPIDVINLNDIDIKGGCLCCYRCGYDNNCTYGNKDGFKEFFLSEIMTADILVYAGTIRDRYLSSRWKLFFERCFFHRTHTPALTGKQLGFIISGPLRQIPNLRQIFEIYSEWQQTNLVDFVTDEDPDEIDALLQGLVERLLWCSNNNYIKPQTFLGVGGGKVMRDDLWGRQRAIFQADHKYYKRHRMYDFPQKDYKTAVLNKTAILLSSIPSFRNRLYTTAANELIKEHRRIVGESS